MSSSIGILLAVSGNIFISIALNIQKLAHNRLSNHHKLKLKKSYSSITVDEQADDYLQSPTWWVGIILMVFGEFAYGYAPASTIAPLGTTALVTNALLAPIILKEKIRLTDILGITLAVIGAIGVVFNTSAKDIKLSPKLLIQILLQLRSIVFYGITIILICLLTIVSKISSHKTVFVNLQLVSLYGCYTVLSTKALSSILNNTLGHIFEYQVTFVLLFVLSASAVMQIKYLNRALQNFDSTIVIPTQFVLFTISAIIGSAVIFKDFDQQDTTQLYWFIISCVTEFFGVYLITTFRTQESNEEHMIHSASMLEEANNNNNNNTLHCSTIIRGISISSQLTAMEDDSI